MKEITVKEMVTALEGVLVSAKSVDMYGMFASFGFSRARLEYDEENNELVFVTGNYNNDNIGVVTYKVDDCIEYILFDEDSGEYTVEFSQYLPDVEIRKAV